MRKLIDLLKAHFFAGVLLLVPIGVIVWIATWALCTVWQIRDLLPDQWNPENIMPNATLGTLFNGAITLAALLLLAIFVSAMGWASKQFFGRKVLEILAHLIDRIPVLRSIYSALDQLLKTMAAQGGQQFSRVVYVEYPRKDAWTLAFVTGSAHPPFGEKDLEYLNIYVPTTPNPTSGFHLIVPEKDVKDAQITVEDAFKVILSLGIAQPSQQGGKNPHGRRR